MRAGWYGREGQRRQRWWCYPKTGPRHRFTETLPRIVAGTGDAHACPECQTTLEPWEGQPAPRLYGFTAKDVAWALSQVAAGATYRGTAAVVRERAGRELEKAPGKSASGRKLAPATQHGQLVSDWVDVFAPVIWQHYAPKQWPGSVVLDDDTLNYSLAGGGGSVVAFYVLGAMAYTENGRPYVAAIEAVPRRSKKGWARFLGTLPRQPRWVVTDGHPMVSGAATIAWPDAEMWRCEWHLRRNLEEKLPRHVRENKSDPLHGKLNYAQLSAANWDTFRAELNHRARAESGFFPVQTMAAKLDSLIREQATGRPDDEPLSTGPLEQFFRTVDHTLGDRAGRMTNKRRADALLKLLAAHRNGWVNAAAWTELIRQHLTACRGLAAMQRQHTDRRGTPSLR